mmetsp:Transcript_33773/g.67237  ORF Transcript_33773/g.67237 Transcript_33773/m.67237 type:complete len:182 (+) Transcript_33773:77-622(+)
MPALAEVIRSGAAEQKHTFVGYKLWGSTPKFGADASFKETNPVWKYQTTAAVMLLGCAIFANIICLVYANTWDTGSKEMDRIHNVGVHLEGLVVSLLAMAVEVEWAQMLEQISVLKNLYARSLLYGLLAALTFEQATTFEYYEYISYVCVGLICNGVIYFAAAIAITVDGCVNKETFDDSL